MAEENTSTSSNTKQNDSSDQQAMPPTMAGGDNGRNGYEPSRGGGNDPFNDGFDPNQISASHPSSDRELQVPRGQVFHYLVNNISKGLSGELTTGSPLDQQKNANQLGRKLLSVYLEENPANPTFQERIDYLRLKNMVLFSEPTMWSPQGSMKGTYQSLKGIIELVENLYEDPESTLKEMGQAFLHPIDTFEAMNEQSRMLQAKILRIEDPEVRVRETATWLNEELFNAIQMAGGAGGIVRGGAAITKEVAAAAKNAATHIKPPTDGTAFAVVTGDLHAVNTLQLAGIANAAKGGIQAAAGGAFAAGPMFNSTNDPTGAPSKRLADGQSVKWQYADDPPPNQGEMALAGEFYLDALEQGNPAEIKQAALKFYKLNDVARNGDICTQIVDHIENRAILKLTQAPEGTAIFALGEEHARTFAGYTAQKMSVLVYPDGELKIVSYPDPDPTIRWGVTTEGSGALDQYEFISAKEAQKLINPNPADRNLSINQHNQLYKLDEAINLAAEAAHDSPFTNLSTANPEPPGP